MNFPICCNILPNQTIQRGKKTEDILINDSISWNYHYLQLLSVESKGIRYPKHDLYEISKYEMNVMWRGGGKRNEKKREQNKDLKIAAFQCY